jgi:hypothetical protein
VPQTIADGAGQGRALADLVQLRLQPGAERLDQWCAAGLAHRPPRLGQLAADLSLNAVQRADAQQGLGGDRRAVMGVDLVKAPAQVAPTEGERDRAVPRPGGERAEAAVAVHLQGAAEPG